MSRPLPFVFRSVIGAMLLYRHLRLAALQHLSARGAATIDDWVLDEVAFPFVPFLRRLCHLRRRVTTNGLECSLQARLVR